MSDFEITTRSDQDRAKLAAGRFAAERLVTDGMRLGLGSGTTSHYFVRALGERVRAGLDVVGVPTSLGTRDLALDQGITLVDLDELDGLDLIIDGPDEIDADGSMIKGGGACLLWEKLVALATTTRVIAADASKAVTTLGAFPLPIEVVQFSHGTTRRAISQVLQRHGYPAELPIVRRERDGQVVITDNGNFILDAHLGQVRDIEALTIELNQIPGVVENGFFVGIADSVVFGWPNGTAAQYSFPFDVEEIRHGSN